jgi:hypothetical protein
MGFILRACSTARYYGTTFAPNKLWSDCLFAALKEYGLTQSKFDPCLFSKPGMMACVYVNDLILAFKEAAEKEKFFEFMKQKAFDLTVGETLDAFLGIKFDRLPDGSFNLTLVDNSLYSFSFVSKGIGKE